ncbi:MFS transporter [Diaphorobacter sp. HDW4A]|uniref:MFS transporter n=1 Tax=Diaphorobacter sp. HDW4A TaxID=2714924 RepID=UPI00140B901B|nr:MFS transporter [Diaphorobacter sp. HDW4A]QIL82248.1 MFS transporter [Diaphorobacter sp. HDW4A]
MPTIESVRGTLTLMVGNCAGMLDLIALPLWVGTLVVHYHFDPQQAGGMPTLFLIGAALSSLFFAPRLNRLNAKWAVVSGFALAAAIFVMCSGESTLAALGPLHFIGGVATGMALSFTHGTIGHANNPHRVFAFAGLAVGIFGIIFLGGTPGVVAKFGGPALFIAFAITMGVAALMALLNFPRRTRTLDINRDSSQSDTKPLPGAIWLMIVAIAFMAMTQAMTLSFYERIGMVRGFGRDMVTLALIVYGVVTLVPAPLAGLLEKHVKATTVISLAPILQGIFAMMITHTSHFGMYEVAGALMGFTILFTHTFAFGLLARLDPSGRAVAGTPAMVMVGAAIAPFLGGTLVHYIGYTAIGYAALGLVAVQLVLFNAARRSIQRRPEYMSPTINALPQA